MIEGIPLGIVDLSGWGLLLLSWALIVTGLVRGLLVPKSTYLTMFEAWKTEKAARAELDNMTSESVQLGRTAVSMLESIKASADEARQNNSERSD